MVICCANGCKSRSERKEEGITFHRFPLKNPIKTQKWVENIHKGEWCPTNNSRLCSKHFEKRYFYNTDNKVYLLDGAVPTIFMELPTVKECTRKSKMSRERNVDITKSTCSSKLNVRIVCKICKKIFLRRSNFQKHLCGEKSKHVACPICGKTFSTRFSLKQHLTLYDHPLKCKISQKSNVQPDILKKHLYANTGLKPYKCKHCEKRFTLKSGLGRHLITHERKKKEPLICNICNKCFLQKKKLTRHMQTHSGEKPFKCETCNKCYTRKDHLNVHLKIHFGEKSFKCNTCELCFYQRSTLNQHMKTHLNNKRFKCEICERFFVRKGSLEQHMKAHLGEKPYECKGCGKTFTRKDSLRVHIKTHFGEKLFKCEACQKSFTRKDHLRVHMKTHFGKKLFKCSICEKYFSYKTTLNKHMQTHLDENPYKCEACKKSFKRKDYLNNHIKTHINEKPFKCEFCKKCFKRKDNLSVHMNIHLGEKLLKCNICSKQFRYKSKLKQHVENGLCDKQLIFKSQLDDHTKIYTSTSCSLCTRSIKDCSCYEKPDDENVNFLKTTSAEDRFMLKCKTCFEKICSKFQLKLHLQTHDEYICALCNDDYKNCSCPHYYSAMEVLKSVSTNESLKEENVEYVVKIKEEEDSFSPASELCVKDEEKSTTLSEMIQDNMCILYNKDNNNTSKHSTNNKDRLTRKEETFTTVNETVVKIEEDCIELSEIVIPKEEPKEEYFEIVQNFV